MEGEWIDRLFAQLNMSDNLTWKSPLVITFLRRTIMPTFTRFEDIHAWQKARELSRMVYAVTSTPVFIKDHALKNQIRRAANSVVLNIAEGNGRLTHREFHQFVMIARGSLSEVQAALYIASDQGYIDNVKFQDIYICAQETGKMLTQLGKYLRKS